LAGHKSASRVSGQVDGGQPNPGWRVNHSLPQQLSSRHPVPRIAWRQNDTISIFISMMCLSTTALCRITAKLGHQKQFKNVTH
jgi:hypothetical protein